MPPDTAEPDETLAQRAQTDHAAFGELVRRYADRIFNLAYRMTGDRSDAEDLTQDAFARAYRGLRGYDPARPFGAWLYRVALNVCLTDRQRRPAAIVEPLAGDEIDNSASAAELAERHEVQETVQQAILGLPPIYRAVIVLYHLEERSYAEIAELLDLPVNTVRTHLHRGRALLRDRMAAYPGIVGGEGT
jgi:RNA polymerase sigma-70 factor (ECF subfamily)